MANDNSKQRELHTRRSLQLRLQRDGSPDISASVRPGNSRRFRLLIHDQAQFSRRGFICSGSKNKTNGYSTIRVLVSVIGFNEDVRPAFARFDPN